MPQCNIVLYGLGTLALAYLAACVVYLIITRFMGRPFHQSLTPAQLAIKKRSAKKRGYVFWIAFFVCLVLCSGCAYYFA